MIKVAIKIPIGAPNMFIVFSRVEFEVLIPLVRKIVGNQLIKVYWTTFIAIRTQDPKMTRFRRSPWNKAE